MKSEAGLSSQSGACAGGRRRQRQKQRGSKYLSLLRGSMALSLQRQWGTISQKPATPWGQQWRKPRGFLPWTCSQGHSLHLFGGPRRMILWNMPKEMGKPDHLTCPLRNLYAGQETIVRTEHEKTDWFQIRNRVSQGCILPSCLFNLACRNLGWMKHYLESRLFWEISITSDMLMTPSLWQKVKRN